MKPPREPGYYFIRHVNSQMFYIGSTSNIYERWHVHRAHLKAGIHKNKLLQSLYDTDPLLEIDFVTSKNREDAYTREQDELDKWHGHELCLNRANSAKSTWKPGTMPENLRESIRDRNRSVHAGQQYRLGMEHSSETIEKMRQTHLRRDRSNDPPRRPISEETREKMRIANSRPRAKGRILSDSHLENMREAAAIRGRERSRSVMIEGVVYDGATYAAEALGVSRRTVVVRIASEDPKWKNWVFHNEVRSTTNL